MYPRLVRSARQSGETNFEIISTIFRLDVHNLHILQIVDIQGWSPNFISLFHKLDPILFHRISQDQQNMPRVANFIDLRNIAQSASVRVSEAKP